MGSLDLSQSLRHLGDSIRKSFSSEGELTVNWSDSVKVVIEDFPQDSAVPDGDAVAKEDKNGLGALEGELILLKAAYALSNVNRRLSLNKLLDLQGNVRVFCRVRPYLSCEEQPESGPLEVLSPTEIRVSCRGEYPKSFKFDKVFLPSSSQEDVFWDVQPTVKSAMEGHNVCIFAYGQTGTGKTYTMEGSKASPGIVPRTLRQLFKDQNLEANVSYRLTLSMLEIYKGTLRDLLVPRPSRIMDPPAKSLNIHMSVSDHIEVENLTEYLIENVEDALKFYRKGMRSRSTSTTSSNDNSSRSHCLVRITVTRNVEKTGKVSRGKLWLIDLGGSERFFKTQAWGKPLEEGKAINVSLTALGDVISALQKKQPHIPYRNSKLTQILRDCLGCNSKVVMFVHASPKEEDYAETICSLSFASRARGVHLNRDVSTHKHHERETRISSIVQKMEALEGECQRLSVDIQALETTIKEKKGDSRGTMLQLVDEFIPANRLVGTEHQAVQNLPRFMTPTISSMCKNRMVVQEFEPVFPEKKLPLKFQLGKHVGVLPSFNSASPQISIDFGRRSIVPARRRSTENHQHHHHHHQQQQQQPAPVLFTPSDKSERPEDASPTEVAACHSLSRISEHRHLRRNSFSHKEDMEQRPSRNMTKIQRRLTLECSSRLSMNI